MLPVSLLRTACLARGLLLVLCVGGWSSVSAADDFDAAVQALNAGNFAQKADAIGRLAEIGDERGEPVLKAMLKGRLFYRKSDRQVVIAVSADGGYRIEDAASGEVLGTIGKRKIKKIGINNSLRKTLRTALARIRLSSTDPAVRHTAVNQMLDSVTPELAVNLRQALQQETDEDVRDAMQTVIALAELQGDEPMARLQAVLQLEGNMHPQVRNYLVDVSENTDDETLAAAAHTAVSNIEAKLQLYSLAETTFFGLSLGSVLLLAAIGLAITFGVMGVINMAHGELIMLGAYTTYLVQMAMPNHLEWSVLVAIPAAFLVSGLFGVAIERGVIRFLYGRPLETLLATFGVSLILQQLVRSTISAQNVVVSNPAWLSGSLQINPAFSLTYNRIYILVFSLLVFLALLAILKKTTLGLQVRAVAQNRAMARAMGVRSQWVDAMTFGLGSGIAGVAGVALSQLTNVGPNMGQSYIIDSFMVVVFGGVGNLWGTLVGALSLGVANKFLEPWSGAVLAKILVLVFIILFIQKRPRGLFPQQGRAAEN
ncbi:MAG: urea ABC transporter permease subunit UrtB [Thermotogales bacterium]|nr:urea ABC transporter permease subunit UrtB [Thermotogales bacterium]